MDAKTLELLAKHPELDTACLAVVRLWLDARKRDGRGETGIQLIFKGDGKPVRYREVVNLVFDN